ncbi:MAG: hypothetical protein HDQ92_01950 [Desulfovibrio sp.]|nr:hypothetical protein [Desulfovibrio sp.]
MALLIPILPQVLAPAPSASEVFFAGVFFLDSTDCPRVKNAGSRAHRAFCERNITETPPEALRALLAVMDSRSPDHTPRRDGFPQLFQENFCTAGDASGPCWVRFSRQTSTRESPWPERARIKTLQELRKRRSLDLAARRDPHKVRQVGPDDPALQPSCRMAAGPGEDQDKEGKFFLEMT